MEDARTYVITYLTTYQSTYLTVMVQHTCGLEGVGVGGRTLSRRLLPTLSHSSSHNMESYVSCSHLLTTDPADLSLLIIV